MISVCIPVYNYPVARLVEALDRQRATAGCEVEVVCIDDASDECFREVNRAVRGFDKWVQLEQNVGRARIRNLFLEHARGEWLVFLDNDSEVEEGFIARYAQWATEKGRVVVGGRKYPKRFDDNRHRLSYGYGVRAESKPAEERAEAPYNSFMTNNFMVHREVLEKIPFDERIVRYGHEDTLFGYQLKQSGVEVVHIDNAVVNGMVEENEEYLKKTVEAVHSLGEIYNRMGQEQDFVNSVKLLRSYNKLKMCKMEWMVECAYRLSRKCLEQKFMRGRSFSLMAYNFYKLGTLINYLDYEDK